MLVPFPEVIVSLALYSGMPDPGYLPAESWCYNPLTSGNKKLWTVTILLWYCLPHGKRAGQSLIIYVYAGQSDTCSVSTCHSVWIVRFGSCPARGGNRRQNLILAQLNRDDSCDLTAYVHACRYIAASYREVSSERKRVSTSLRLVA